MADVEGLFLRGKEAADRGNYDYAIALFCDLLRFTPDHRNARIALRGCEMERFRNCGGGFKAKLLALVKGIGPLILMQLTKDKRKVIDLCERFLVNDPTNIAVLRKMANACVACGYIEAAADTLEFGRQRDPKNLGLLRHLGEVSYSQGAFDKAIRCFQEIVAVKPADHNAAQRAKDISAEAHMKRSHMEQAGSFRETLRDQVQTDEMLREDQLHRTDQEKDAEIRKWKEALEADKEDGNAHAALGDALYKAQRYREAEEHYREAFRITKKFAMREKMGDTRIRQLESIVRKAEKEVEESGKAPDALAKAREAKQKHLEFCIKEYTFRRQQHPTDMKLAFQLGQFHVQAGGPKNIQGAIQLFQQTVSNSALKVRSQYMLGRCFARDPKTLDMAAEQFELALTGMDDASNEMGKELLYALGQIDEKLGRKEDALVRYKKVFAVDAGFRDVAQKIQSLG